MATSLDHKAFQLAEHSRRIQRLEAEVEELRPRKRKKVAPEDLNKKFVTIENVIAMKENLAKTLEATKANTVFNFEDMCTAGFLSIRHIHMEIFHMDMEYGIHMDTYGHTKIILASGHNTTSQSSLLSFYRLQSSQQLRCL